MNRDRIEWLIIVGGVAGAILVGWVQAYVGVW
jgi:hypothetical protein